MIAKNKQYRKQPQPPKKLNGPRTQASIESEGMNPNYLKWILVLCVAIATFVTYRYTLHNEFTNWDDGLYVETNPYIKNLTPQNLKMILFHNITNNYYHPITMLSIAWNYHSAKMEPHAYYLTNVAIHTLNACVMFFLILFLLEAMTERGYGKIEGKPWLAALGALMYGVHPMHVESVAWLAERKDVLYAFFYFLGLIAYLRYVNKEKKNLDNPESYNASLFNSLKWFAPVVLCYLCSLMSKPLAVVFPFSLFAMDVLLKRNNIRKILIEKAPFFLVSLGGGIWAWHAQKASGAVASFHTFSIIERTMFASYGFVMYIAKSFVPIHLCSYYPYPATDKGGMLPTIFYLAPFISVIIMALPLFLAYKASKNFLRIVIFGLGFFFFNVVFVLQFISSGPAIMADRYSYVAYFGIFFLVIYFASLIMEKSAAYRTPIFAILSAFTIYLAFLCYDRTMIWHSTETLWKDVIAKYPFQVETSYKNLGNFYAEKGQYDSAYTNYKILADMNSKDAGVYSNIGNIYGLRKDFPKSLAAYSQALKLDSNNFDSYLDRAITYSIMQDYPNAFKDYDRAYKMNPNSEKLLENRGYTYMTDKQYDKSIADYSQLLQIDPDKPAIFFNRGIAEFNKGDNEATLQDFLHTLRGDPQNKDCLYDVALVYERLKDYKNALDYALKAKQAGFAVQDEYIEKLKSSAH
jgi:tetratricopeptide (TPR) repeat protein